MSKQATTSAIQRTSLPAIRVGYVMTHYPKLAQTFIANEIIAVERAGLDITCFAMNAPTDAERGAPGAGVEIGRTHYLKASTLFAVTSLMLQTLWHPLGMAKVWAMALKSGGSSPRRIVRRIAHLAQAALVADITKREGIDRLHAHFGLAPTTIAWLATAIASARGLPQASFTFTIHGYHDFVDPDEARLDLKARDAAAVLCISDYTRSQLYQRSAPSLWPHFYVARCGIDTDAFAYRDPPPIKGAPTLMALGRLSPEKGFVVLIEAIARLQEDGILTKLRIIGDGPIRSELEALTQQLGICEAVTFAGEVSPIEVAKELAAADIFCMASFSEGLPISIMEAMAIGVPVVTTWIAGIPELAQDGITAVTVPPANAEAFANAIRRLLQDERLGQKLARAARKRVVENHDLWRAGEQVAALLKSEK